MLQTQTLFGVYSSTVVDGVSFRASSVNLYWRRGEGGEGGHWHRLTTLRTTGHCCKSDNFWFWNIFQRRYKVPVERAYGTNFWFCSINHQKWYPVSVDRGFGGGGKQFAMTSQLETIGWDLTVLAFRFYLGRTTTVTKRSIFVNLSDWHATKYESRWKCRFCDLWAQFKWGSLTSIPPLSLSHTLQKFSNCDHRHSEECFCGYL